MAEYIEREALLKILRGSAVGKYPASFYMGLFAAANEVEKIPAADVAPVVRGRWVDHMVRDWRCSECGEKIHKVRKVDGYCYDDKPNYCPNCGARMDGEE